MSRQLALGQLHGERPRATGPEGGRACSIWHALMWRSRGLPTTAAGQWAGQTTGPSSFVLPGRRLNSELTVGWETVYRLTAMDDQCSPPCSCEASPAPPGLLPGPGSDDAELAIVAKALGHPVRVQILRTLLEQRACFCGVLVAALPLAQSTVSEHLRILREAGLVQGDIDGPRVCYCARPERLLQLIELAQALAGTSVSAELEAVRR